MTNVFKIAALSLTALLLLASCKGRTTADVEADGETVEVNIPENVQDSDAIVSPADIDSSI